MSLYLLKNVFPPHIMLELYHSLYKSNYQDLIKEYQIKIQMGHYDALVYSLKYLFLLYKAGEYPTPWEARHHQIKLERVDNFIGVPFTQPGKFQLKLLVGPSYFLIPDFLYYRPST